MICSCKGAEVERIKIQNTVHTLQSVFNNSFCWRAAGFSPSNSSALVLCSFGKEVKGGERRWKEVLFMCVLFNSTLTSMMRMSQQQRPLVLWQNVPVSPNLLAVPAHSCTRLYDSCFLLAQLKCGNNMWLSCTVTNTVKIQGNLLTVSDVQLPGITWCPFRTVRPASRRQWNFLCEWNNFCLCILMDPPNAVYVTDISSCQTVPAASVIRCFIDTWATAQNGFKLFSKV